jgi:hypothetical protein
MPQHKAREGNERASGYIRDAAEATKAGVDRASDYLEGVTDQATGYMKRTVSDAQKAVAELGNRRVGHVGRRAAVRQASSGDRAVDRRSDWPDAGAPD